MLVARISGYSVMTFSNIRAITNNYQDARLLSLSSWKRAAEIELRDQGGPYVVTQEGYDPEDFRMRINEFVLGRSGKWLGLGAFFQLPAEIRQREFIFGTAAEVIETMDRLQGKAQVQHGGVPADPVEEGETQDLRKAVEEARQT